MEAMVPPAFALPDPDSETVLHLLNRLTFGPRPGDIDRVQRLGIQRWLEYQLAPSRIPDPVDTMVRRVYAAAFEPPAELYLEYPRPNQAAAANRKNAPAAGDQPGDSMMAARTRQTVRRLNTDVVMATLLRHAESERQLEEVMTDFWFNHFNVFIGKNADRWLTSDYIERAIRPNALGNFETLLKAVAHHPAMLVYLDNFQSVAPGSEPPNARRFAARMPEQARRQMPTGINENYGRELLELHTLGVDGGYTQQDVQNVARILTGWSIAGPNARPTGGRFGNNIEPFSFEFHDWAHDRGEKVVLGTVFPAGHGQDEGERLLTMLANSPATARHIAHKLCERLVSDDSPDGCVDHATAAFLRTHGDIAAVIRAIVESPDFWAGTARRSKVKTPLEFVVSALRATGAVPDTSPRLGFVLQTLGQPLFQQQVPTGYPETQEMWVNSGALLNRMNVAMGIATGRLPGIDVDLEPVVPMTGDKDALVAEVNTAILAGMASPNTLRVIRQQIDDINDPSAARAMAVGLALGSPEFQRQ
ncbi:MAG TPA: DUF1800 domain-containing protein [Gemmatimonadales bacterium]|jgi:uncharacterized protein (DUF1800 family)